MNPLPESGEEATWYKDAVIYELRVRSFFDSVGDGFGDIRGVIEKLDYLEDLGITALWLLPFYPSPQRDDGYDIADFTSVHPEVGTLSDFRLLLREAHRRGLRVITELVLNHTSDQHPWFQRARHAKPGSRARDFYVWSQSAEKYPDARIIFKDFEPSNWTWDPVAKAHYWHRFYSHQPDLNYDNPVVRRAMFKVVDFWLRLGVDGLRLDAVPYLIEREGTSCENLPGTHAVLKELRRHIDSKFSNRMLLAEANQWPEDAVAYFGQDDECHMAFHFPIMPRLFMSIQTEDRYPIVDVLAQTPALPPNSQWALFLRNHDELTLEMVTDEERDYMYRVYAQEQQARLNLGIRRRLAPLLGNDRRKLELMYGLLFSLPGTPVLYYGDEIGMGDNFHLGDRNGVRTPMQWSGDRNAGFSRANPQKLVLPVVIDPEYHFEAVNVETQQGNPNSFLWWIRRLISLRKRFTAFGRGTMEFLQPRNHKILAYLREHHDERLMVVANLSRFTQPFTLDLSRFEGWTPVDLQGQTRFPRIGRQPYSLTLGSRGFCWFTLLPPALPVEQAGTASGRQVPEFRLQGHWRELLVGEHTARLESVLPSYLTERSWFMSPRQAVRAVSLLDAVPIRDGGTEVFYALMRVDFIEGQPEDYALAVAFARREEVDRLCAGHPNSVIAAVQCVEDGQEVEGALFDALHGQTFSSALLRALARNRRFKGGHGTIYTHRSSEFQRLAGAQRDVLLPSARATEQSYAVVSYSDKMLLKLYRRVEPGQNPDLELGRYLNKKARFPSTPAVAGHLEYRVAGRQPIILGVLQEFVTNEADGWKLAQHHLGQFFERVLSSAMSVEDLKTAQAGEGIFTCLQPVEPPALLVPLTGAFLELARLLGHRTATLHRALGQARDIRDMAPEPFTPFYCRSIYQSARNATAAVLRQLQEGFEGLAPALQPGARKLMDSRSILLREFQKLLETPIDGLRLRVHGDYHLEQVLFTGKDFAVIDFEGDAVRPLSERRLKRSPLRDVVSMMRSFHYAARWALHGRGTVIRPGDAAILEPWADIWTDWVCSVFFKAYMKSADLELLPQKPFALQTLLRCLLLEAALRQLGRELQARPTWTRIPLEGVLQLLEDVRLK